MSETNVTTGLPEAAVAIEPRTRFVPLRALRRVIRITRQEREFHARAVHERAFWIDRDLLFGLLTPDELGLSPDENADHLLLLPVGDEGQEGENALKLWRDLFHVAVDSRVEELVAGGLVKPGDVRRALGLARWDAIRQVLEEENLIGPEDGERVVLREFTSFSLEVVYFDPQNWEVYFPGLRAESEPLRSLWELVGHPALFGRARPPQCESPGAGLTAKSPGQSFHIPAEPAHVSDYPPPAREFGNTVRKAIGLARANNPAADRKLGTLVERFGTQLGLSKHETEAWQSAAQSLLRAAARGGWPAERRFLYELQRACLSLERPAYAVDLVEWAVTFGKRPVKRRLPRTRWVNTVRRLRAALGLARKIAGERSPLTHLVESAIHITERYAREDLRPHLVAVLDEVGLSPESVAEKHSREKLVEELLDAACAKGFLRIGDLRDAIARNRVKLDDLCGPGEFLRGDALLQANQRLPVRLDGVYRRGEVYLRLLQRACSLFFGTRVGRWVTRYVALPFGGSYVLLEGLFHLKEAGEDLVDWISGQTAAVHGVSLLGGGVAGTLADNPTLEVGGVSWSSFLSVAMFLMLMLHWPAFRGRVMGVVRFVFQKVPAAIRRSSLVRSFLNNVATRLFRRYVFIPLGVGGLVGAGYYLLVRDGLSAGLLGGGIALFTGAFFRTPFGRRCEDRVDEAIARFWRVVTVNLAVGLITLVLHFFQGIFEAIDQAIYSVDQWLRFREGQGRFAFTFKLLFGAVWFVLTYVFRFAWTLMVEPQVNPIKHFPVVTVSHKLLLPLIPSLAKEFNLHEKTMGTIVFGIPGIFGFLVWEFRENWKLYRSNASPTLQPVIVGSHGEKVRGLLRPGLHSGVVPKTFAKLRRAVRNGKENRAARARHSIEHVAEAVERFFERDFVAYLRGSRRWNGVTMHTKVPVLTPNDLILPLVVGAGDHEVRVHLEERGGWVIGSVRDHDGVAALSANERAAFLDALTGLYKCAGVDLVREQVARVFGMQAYSFDAVAEGLWIPLSDGEVRFFDYDDGWEIETPERALPTETIVFSRCPLKWSDWSDRWEADAAGKSPQVPLLPGWTLVRGPNSE